MGEGKDKGESEGKDTARRGRGEVMDEGEGT